MEELLDEDVGDAEGGAGLATGLVEGGIERISHSTTRIPRPPPPIDALMMTGYPSDSARAWASGPACTGASLPESTGCRPRGQATCGDLVAEPVEHLRRGADEGDPGRRAGAGELGILGEEAVAGVDRVDFLLSGQFDDRRDVEIATDRLAGATDLVRLVGLEAMRREPILVRVDRDGPDAQLVRRSEDTNGDLAPVGGHQLAEWGHRGFLIIGDCGGIMPGPGRLGIRV